MFKQSRKEKCQQIGYYIAVLFLVIVFFFPNFQQGVFKGSDGGYHLARIASLADAMSSGVFPAKVRPVLMKTYGYGVGFFYPDYMLYFPALLIHLGICDVDMAYKITLLLMLFVGSFSVFFITQKIIKRLPVALVSVALFLGTRNLWVDVYQRGGVGSMMAYMFLPMAIGGVILALRDIKSGYVWYGIGLIGMLFTHHITFITVLISLIILGICNIKRIVDTPKIAGRIIAVSFVDLFISTMYWLPAIEQVTHINFIAIYGNYLSIGDNVSSFGTMLSERYTLELFLLFVVATVVFLTLLLNRKVTYKMGGDVVLTGWLLVWLCSSNLFWKSAIGDSLSFLQYTERFSYVTCAMMNYGIVLVLDGLLTVAEDKKNTILGVMHPLAIPIICFLAVLYFVGAFPEVIIGKVSDLEKSDMKRQFVEAYNMGAGQEWLPIETLYTACDTPNSAKANDGTGADGIKTDNGKMFDVWVMLDKEYYDMPYVYYYGYHAYLMDDNGAVKEELLCDKASDNNGLLRVFMPGENGVGRIIVTYRKTLIQKVAYCISFISVISVLGFALYQKIRKKDENFISQ